MSTSMLEYYQRKPMMQDLKGMNSLFTIPVSQIDRAIPIEVDTKESETPSSKALGKDDLINKISKVKAKQHTYCFEIKLKSDYESLHMLKNVNNALNKRS